MQERYAVVGLTIEEFTHPVNTPQKTFSPYGDSDEESDYSPPTPTNIKANEKKIDDSLRNFVEALPYLETLHYGFKYQALGRNGYCFCALTTCLSSWRKKHHVDNDFSRCSSKQFHGKVFFNIVVIKGMIITQQLPIILQICSIIKQDQHRLRSIMEKKSIKVDC
jgi:hypothetical protein